MAFPFLYHQLGRARGWNILRLVLGVLLLAAAGLKLAGQGVSAIPQVAWYATPMVQIAAAEWEIVLGLWLLSGWFPIGAWLAAVATFLTFAGVSGYLGWIGVASCGCFGVIQASPWWAFGIDVVIVVLLTVSRPQVAIPGMVAGVTWRSSAANGAWSVVLISTFLVCGSCAAVAACGSFQGALACLRGEAITTEPSYIDFGKAQPGAKLERDVEVRNWTDQPIELIGGTSDCSCVATDTLPVVLPPRRLTRITVRLKVPNSARGRMTRTGVLWTNCEDQRIVNLVVVCRVEE